MISFRLGSLPVGIRPIFFVTVVLIGVIGPRRSPSSLALWVGIVLVSVFLHELGHALVARRYGATVAIEFFALGGLTRWHRDPPVPAGGRVLIAAAGSAIGIAIGLATFALFRDSVRSDALAPLLEQAVLDVIFVNLGWGILNWLPIRLLDGGHILGGLLEIWFPRRHQQISRVVFLASAAALTGLALWLQEIWLAVLFALFGFTGESRPPDRPAQPDLPRRLSAAQEALAAGEYQAAAEQATSLLATLESPEDQAAASRILLRALLAQGKVQEAVRLVEEPPEGFRPGAAEAGRVLLVAGHLKQAIETLSSALGGGDGDALAPLALAHRQAGTFTEAAAFLRQVPPHVLSPQPILALAEDAEGAGASGDAAELRRLAAEIEVEEGHPSQE